ncbi:hypothetical protein PI124_g18480 [Phytophthora idaei]|nr:hypothetical protein PI125_g21706 [Phytophthora idaei]KAG3162236.1 hypothetical protein PI126_g6057 [Phytophthora idaei]KAG3236514.1 hypothetical protein PI124_g18480 [Phytophthora idaei]
MNRLKKFSGRMSQPFPTEIPDGVETLPDSNDEDPLNEDDIPPTSFIERLNIGDGEPAFCGVGSAVVDVLAKRVVRGEEQYLVLTPTYEVCWKRTSTLLPECPLLIKAYENIVSQENGWPELRHSVRPADTNDAADEVELCFRTCLER